MSNFDRIFCKQTGDPDQASDMGLHCLSMSVEGRWDTVLVMSVHLSDLIVRPFKACSAVYSKKVIATDNNFACREHENIA